MGEMSPPDTMGFNRFVYIESRVNRLTGDRGAVLLRKIVEKSGIVVCMISGLTDPPGPVDVKWSCFVFSHRRAAGGAGLEATAIMRTCRAPIGRSAWPPVPKPG
jgi:hypothetical protein